MRRGTVIGCLLFKSDKVNTMLGHFVMPGLVPGIYVFLRRD
jgi:hypothetical protein